MPGDPWVRSGHVSAARGMRLTRVRLGGLHLTRVRLARACTSELSCNGVMRYPIATGSTYNEKWGSKAQKRPNSCHLLVSGRCWKSDACHLIPSGRFWNRKTCRLLPNDGFWRGKTRDLLPNGRFWKKGACHLLPNSSRVCHLTVSGRLSKWQAYAALADSLWVPPRSSAPTRPHGRSAAKPQCSGAFRRFKAILLCGRSAAKPQRSISFGCFEAILLCGRTIARRRSTTFRGLRPRRLPRIR